jgi:serine phosphatase RsbU (regulator of sigma subunit)/pSer/pThr/pTyr-binding forkhead associated (FHA) protein
MPKLTVQNGVRSGTEFQFEGSAVIGRGAGADLSLGDPGVSRQHARLTCRDGACQVEDLGSVNGTLVNGHRVTRPTVLHEGDIVGMGPVRVKYSEGRPEAGTTSGQPSVQYVEGGDGPEVVLRVPADEEPPAPKSKTSGGTSMTSRPLKFLEDFGKISDLVFDERALLSFVVDELLNFMPRADRAFVMLWDRESQKLQASTARARTGESTEIIASQTVLEDVIAKREAVLAIDMQMERRYAEAASIRALGLRAAICVPMIFQKEIYGVIQVDSTSRSMPFDKADVAMALSLASQVGMALACARLHATIVEQELVAHDLLLAKKIQQHFLPLHPPNVTGYAFAMENHGALAVGGDFYDFLDLGSGLVGIILGDASGKGVSAALYAAKLTADLRYQAAGQTEPAAILERTNRAVADRDNEGMFATVSVAVLEPKTGRLQLSSAGHLLPLLRDASGKVVPLGKTGDAPLGVNATATFAQHEYELTRGDAILFYTDGVTEAMNEKRKLYGERRLLDAIRRSAGTPKGIVDAVQADVRAFVGSEPPSDDLTVVALGRTG